MSFPGADENVEKRWKKGGDRAAQRNGWHQQSEAISGAQERKTHPLFCIAASHSFFFLF